MFETKTIIINAVPNTKDALVWLMAHPQVEAVDYDGNFVIEVADDYSDCLEVEFNGKFGIDKISGTINEDIKGGVVSQAHSEMEAAINSISNHIAKVAEELGFKTEVGYSADKERGSRLEGKIDVEVELFRSKTPQIIEFTVYDTDDIVAGIQRSLCKPLREKNYRTFSSADEIEGFLSDIREKIHVNRNNQE